MGRSYKIVVTGAFNSGKSTFVRTISDIPVVSTERRISDDQATVKEQTTVAMDYGQVSLDGNLFHLFGTPGQMRFDFMWDILSKETDALLLLVDSADRPTHTVARRILRRLRGRLRIPFLVVATKNDQERAMSAAEIAANLRVELPPTGVVTCDPRDKTSARAVVEQLAVLLAQ